MLSSTARINTAHCGIHRLENKPSSSKAAGNVRDVPPYLLDRIARQATTDGAQESVQRVPVYDSCVRQTRIKPTPNTPPYDHTDCLLKSNSGESLTIYTLTYT
eukprot:1178334-Prorocentrum_minimum.AAC.3